MSKTPKPLYLPLKTVTVRLNPYRENQWLSHRTPIRIYEIRQAIHEKRFERKWLKIYSRKGNIERTAWFVVHICCKPIEINVGCPEFDKDHRGVIITDGWHRLAAAIYRGDKTIRANVSGSLAYAEEIFGQDCSQY